MSAADSKPGQLQVAPSSSSSCTFKPPSSPGNLDGLGLNPVQKVRVRPAVMKKKKPTALDKQRRHVALIQCHNRQKAEQQQQQQQVQQKHQTLADFTQQLRTLILTGNTEALQQTWQPAAAAVCLQESQTAAAVQTEQVKHNLPCNVYPHVSHKVPDSHDVMISSNNTCADWPAATAAAPATAVESCSPEDDDVDGFLDSLLQQAAQIKVNNKRPAKPAHHATAAGSGSRPGSAQQQQQQQRSKSHKPAWALTEKQQAALEQAHLQAPQPAESAQLGEEAEEAELLEFAEHLSWEDFVGQLDDEQLAAAFKELDVAEQQAAAGDPLADKQWRHCFVAAINHAAMKDIAAAAAARSSRGGGSRFGEEQDRHSEQSSASQARRADAVAARRQKLLDCLSRLGGAAATPATAVTTGGSCQGGGSSVCSRAGAAAAAAAAAAVAAADWDRSTRAGGNDVAQLQSALKTLEAGDVLLENPDMKGVHSVASVRSMLQKMDLRTGSGS